MKIDQTDHHMLSRHLVTISYLSSVFQLLLTPVFMQFQHGLGQNKSKINVYKFNALGCW